MFTIIINDLKVFFKISRYCIYLWDLWPISFKNSLQSSGRFRFCCQSWVLNVVSHKLSYLCAKKSNECAIFYRFSTSEFKTVKHHLMRELLSWVLEETYWKLYVIPKQKILSSFVVLKQIYQCFSKSSLSVGLWNHKVDLFIHWYCWLLICRNWNKGNLAHWSFSSATKVLGKQSMWQTWYLRTVSLGSVLTFGRLVFLDAELASNWRNWIFFFFRTRIWRINNQVIWIINETIGRVVSQ